MTGMSNTDFAQWRRKEGLSLNGAARALGLSRYTVICLERGKDYSGRTSTVQPDTQLLMAYISKYGVMDESLAA